MQNARYLAAIESQFLLSFMMNNKSPVHQACYYEAYGFDLDKDFSQFLEEAKQNVNEAKLKSSSVHPEEYGKTGLEKVKKDKKSWKSCLISWWKADKKSKHSAEPTNNNYESKVYGKRKGHVSGPIYNCAKGPDVKHRRPNSGPLTSLFKSAKREECEIPYMSLHQQNNPRAVHNYGPLYVVS
ncbi:hypothetical protein VNO77_18799 [Canavalia gladiata]|uniref:Uncharacterized protein n=1 Tax=Canavalia gladiata TaxID=3824 RepID=A0AAN9LQD5_CANGL